MAAVPKTIEAVTRQIEILAEAGRQIRECGDLKEIQRHKNVMEQLRLLAKRLKAGRDVQNAAWKEAMQSRRAVGRLLIKMADEGERRTRGGDQKSNGHDVRLKLADLGIPEKESQRSQALAYIPDEDLTRIIEKYESVGEELLTRDFVDLGMKIKRAQEEARRMMEQAEQAESGEEDDDDDEGESGEEDVDDEGAADDEEAAKEAAKREEKERLKRAYKQATGWLYNVAEYFIGLKHIGGVLVLTRKWTVELKENYIVGLRETAARFEGVARELEESLDG